MKFILHTARISIAFAFAPTQQVERKEDRSRRRRRRRKKKEAASCSAAGRPLEFCIHEIEDAQLEERWERSRFRAALHERTKNPGLKCKKRKKKPCCKVFSLVENAAVS